MHFLRSVLLVVQIPKAGGLSKQALACRVHPSLGTCTIQCLGGEEEEVGRGVEGACGGGSRVQPLSSNGRLV